MSKLSASYPPIDAYALISDCHSVALVSRAGSVDWCCMRRIDNDSSFGRLLDWQRGGFWSIAPCADFTSTRAYAPGTLVLTTEFHCGEGAVRLHDFFAVFDVDEERGHALLVRIVEGVQGDVELAFHCAPRCDYGTLVPRIQTRAAHLYTAWGSNQGLLLYADAPLQVDGADLTARLRVRAGERLRFSARFLRPEHLSDPDLAAPESAAWLDRRLDDSVQHWRAWAGHLHAQYRDEPQLLRSALTLKALTYERTGAIAAAATTSLPEWIGAERNWDYRYSWIRDSVFTVRALHQLGFLREADRFACFIQRSAGADADQLQTVFGVDGHRRIVELELPALEGYRASRPVRIGNAASTQLQLDAYGELLELAWIRHQHGRAVGQDWDFLADIVEVAARRWREPDYGIWEVRAEPQHFVFSKALCWVALQRGIQLAQACGFAAPLERWIATREAIRRDIETHGYDAERGVFRQAYGNTHADAALLLLPWFHFVAYDDPRMVRTVDHVARALDAKGLLLRYDSPDGLRGREGAFVPCTFWLVDCLARQGRTEEARRYYARAARCANDLGVFSEEYDTERETMLGNFAQGLSHVSQVIAFLALAKEGWRDESDAFSGEEPVSHPQRQNGGQR